MRQYLKCLLLCGIGGLLYIGLEFVREGLERL